MVYAFGALFTCDVLVKDFFPSWKTLLTKIWIIESKIRFFLNVEITSLYYDAKPIN